MLKAHKSVREYGRVAPKSRAFRPEEQFLSMSATSDESESHPLTPLNPLMQPSSPLAQPIHQNLAEDGTPQQKAPSKGQPTRNHSECTGLSSSSLRDGGRLGNLNYSPCDT